jgi:hypothetical protein
MHRPHDIRISNGNPAHLKLEADPFVDEHAVLNQVPVHTGSYRAETC